MHWFSVYLHPQAQNLFSDQCQHVRDYSNRKATQWFQNKDFVRSFIEDKDSQWMTLGSFRVQTKGCMRDKYCFCFLDQAKWLVPSVKKLYFKIMKLEGITILQFYSFLNCHTTQ